MIGEKTAEWIIAAEKEALERWNQGNPDGYLDLYGDEITYFDPFHSKRIDGLDAMTDLYESLRGEIEIDRYEMIDPQVSATGDVAVLTYNLYSWAGDILFPWNCTQIYRRENGQWKIIHNHWSFIRPMDIPIESML